MKALSLWQPWASLLASGHKTIETRSWETSYRGLIAIHAAKHLTPYKLYPGEDYPSIAMRRAAYDLLFEGDRFEPGTECRAGQDFEPPVRVLPEDLREALPRGKVLAIAVLWDIQPIGKAPGGEVSLGGISARELPWFEGIREIAFGDFSAGRYAWIFKEMTELVEPIEAKGKQQIWNWDEAPSA